jgi:hypothetical protein
LLPPEWLWGLGRGRVFFSFFVNPTRHACELWIDSTENAHMQSVLHGMVSFQAPYLLISLTTIKLYP